MTPDQLTIAALAAFVLYTQIADRLSRRRRDNDADADRAIKLKDERIEELEERLSKYAEQQKDNERRFQAMKSALRFLFDEIGKTDRCQNAAAGCVNRVPPVAGNDDLTKEIRRLVFEDTLANVDGGYTAHG